MKNKVPRFPLVALLVSIFAVSLQAQFPGGGGMGGNNKDKGGNGGFNMGNLPKEITQAVKLNFGRVYGRIVDAKTKKGVEFASVAIYKKDTLAGGQLTEANGDFSLTDLNMGGYKLKVSYVGYKTIEQPVTITMGKAEQDIGDIALEEDEKVLNTVTVTAERPTMELKPDRKVFYVDKDISTRGGTGVDVMKNIPGLSVDADGGISLRNNTPQVYVDGKPTTLTLEQIPADQIEKVEVITNPSARFEAAAGGGIVNVVLKKNQKPGYNGMVNVNIGTNTLYNVTGLLNVRERKFGVMLTYSVNSATNRAMSFTDRTNLNEGAPLSHFRQDQNSSFNRTFQFARFGFDYYITNRNTLSFAENVSFGNFNTDELQKFSTTFFKDSLQNRFGTQNNDQRSHFQNYTTDLSFKHTYPTPDKEWTLNINYNYTQGGSNYLYTTNSMRRDSLGNVLALNPDLQKTAGAQHSHQIIGQWDFTTPLPHNMKLETGARTTYKRSYSNQDVTDTSYVLGMDVRNAALSTNYIIDDMVNAAYVTFAHSIKGFSYQVGLRLEESYYRGFVPDSNRTFGYQFPSNADNFYYSIFPSLNLSQKFGDKHELQFNITRKINRPNFFQISPFTFYSDKFNYRRGEPNLQPEFSNQAELNYNFVVNRFNWLSSLYGRYTQSPITPYNRPLENDTTGILVNTFTNAKSSFSYGWENTVKFTPVKNLDITLDGNVFYTSIKGTADSFSISSSGISYVLKGMISYKFPLGIVFQANGTYESPKVIAQGNTTPVYFFDLSLSRDFGIASVNLTVSDVLNSRTFGSIVNAPAYTQESTRRRDVRYAKLGVTFRFGKMDASLFKRKTKKTDTNNNVEDLGY